MDYRKANPQAVYELKKVALRLRRKGKEIREIREITGLADKTVRMAFAAYDAGGLKAIKPKRRGRKDGEKRTLNPEQEQEVTAMLVDHDPAQLKLKDAGKCSGTYQTEIWDIYAHSDGGGIFTPVGIYCSAASKTGGKSKAGTGGSVAERRLSVYTPQRQG